MRKLWQLLLVLQNSNTKGWQAFEGPRNRYQLVENIMNPSYSDLRTLLYEYHLKGLDEMVDDKTAGRAIIARTLKNFEKFTIKGPDYIFCKCF